MSTEDPFFSMVVDVNEPFVSWLAAMPAPRVIEVGTRRSDPDFPTHHAAWVPDGGEHVKVDVQSGTDVDVVADAESMVPFADDEADAVICVSTLEHIPRPWRAIEQFERILRPGGRAFVATHQTFPIHGYPSDYFRFTDKALEMLGTDVGLEVLEAGYGYPAKIVPPRSVKRWNPAAHAYLNVAAVYRKPV